MNISRLENRAKLINYIYYFQLFDERISSDRAFEEGSFSNRDIKVLDAIANRQDTFIKIAVKFIGKNWTWERIAPLLRAIIIYGAFELTFNDKALVINELITITRGYVPGDDYKFINAILDNIGEYYEKNKTNKKNS